MAGGRKNLSPSATSNQVAQFLERVAAVPADRKPGRRGRLIFAIDATARREPTWDIACQIQAEMFSQTNELGGLDIQLCFYRGFGEFKKTKWVGSADELIRRMARVRCVAGRTQIGKLLSHAARETRESKVDAVVFVGDVVEEDVDKLGHLAGELGVLGTPAFIFHEGGEPSSARAMKQIANLSGGAYCPFDIGSAAQLRELLTAVAVYSAGGRQALEDLGRRTGGQVPQIARQLALPGRTPSPGSR
jgi:hypothetical protein